MRGQEAKRLALLIVLDEMERAFDTSDEWVRHPETDALLSFDELQKVRCQARLFLDSLEARVFRLKGE